MNILFIVPYAPNLIRVRPYNLIRYLSERGHKVTVQTIWTNEQERKSLFDLEQFSYRVQSFHLPTWRSMLNCLLAFPTGIPLQSAYSWQRGMAKEINSMSLPSNGAPPFHVVHVEHLRGARYGLVLNKFLSDFQKSIPIIWDSVDSISLLFRQAIKHNKSAVGRMIARVELRRTEKYEAWLSKQFNRVLVTSQSDKDAILSLSDSIGDKSCISVLPNGVDQEYFHPDESTLRSKDTIVVSGKMSYHANVTMVLHLVEDIMPRVWARRPDVKLCILGKDPPKKILSLVENPRIIVTGTVPDIRPYLHKATIAVAPVLYGAGIQNKVLEAMASGVPMIASPQAVSALQITAGKDLLVAQDSDEFAEMVLNLLNDANQQNKFRNAGLSYVKKNHDWRLIAANLEKIYEQMANDSNQVLAG